MNYIDELIKDGTPITKSVYIITDDLEIKQGVMISIDQHYHYEKGMTVTYSISVDYVHEDGGVIHGNYSDKCVWLTEAEAKIAIDNMITDEIKIKENEILELSQLKETITAN